MSDRKNSQNFHTVKWGGLHSVKFHDFPIIQILREINFGESRSSKTAIFAILWLLILLIW